MELPNLLKQAVDAALNGKTVQDIARAAAALSTRYRAEVRDGRYHLADDQAALAYLATRLPATYAAIRSALSMTAHEIPGFSPTTMLDVGAGPGTALWAAVDQWPSCNEALMIEGSAAIRQWGERLSVPLAREVSWKSGDILVDLPQKDSPLSQRDLVTMGYVLDEISPDKRPALIERLWALTSGVLLIIEPGTPAGHARILAVREQLIKAGAHILAPCMHAATCPITAPDWCHFSRRVSRSRIHRLAKGGEVPWEDEKYIFIAAARTSVIAKWDADSGSSEGEAESSRILALPRGSGGRVQLKICQSDGSAVERTFSRRDGEAYKKARRADWGDRL